MKKKKTPFTIGEQYELHEFELEEVKTELRGNYEYDVYRCSKKLFDSLELDGLTDIKLYYNADILARVDYTFIKSNIEFIDFKELDSCIKVEINNFKSFIKIKIQHKKYSN